MVLDIVLVVIMALFLVTGYRRGLAKTLLGLVGTLASAVVAFLLFKPIADILKKMPNVQAIIKQIAEVISTSITPSVGGKIEVPVFLNGIIDSNSINGTVKASTNQLADVAAGFVADVAILILLIIAIKLAINIAMLVSSAITSLPGIRILDKTLGGVVGLAYGFIAVYIFCALLFVVLSTNQGSEIRGMVEQSVLAQYFYSHNILIDLFIKKPVV